MLPDTEPKQPATHCLRSHLLPEYVKGVKRRCKACKKLRDAAVRAERNTVLELQRIPLREKAAQVAAGLPPLTDSQIVRLRNVLGGAR
jgi:hypothetical protein